MSTASPCILLHEGLVPHAVPLAGRQPLAALGVTAAFQPPLQDAPLWDGPVAGRVVTDGGGAPLFLCGECSSTFDVAWELVQQGCLPPWGAVLALSQSSGRGQLRRSWHSPQDNLHVSFRLPDDAFFVHDAVPLTVGLLIQQALAALHIKTLLKWPNDILLPVGKLGAKAGGLLLEEREGILLVGLGLNLRHAPAPSLLRETHAIPAEALNIRLAPLPLWLKIAVGIQRKYTALRCMPLPEILRQVEAVLAWKGFPLTVRDNDNDVSGHIAGVTEKGELLLRSRNGLVRRVCSGSVVLDRTGQDEVDAGSSSSL